MHAPEFIPLLFLIVLNLSFAWKGYVTTSTSLAEFSSQIVPSAITGLTLTDVHRTATDFVLLIVNLNVYAANAYEEMTITIYRDGVNLVPVGLKVLRAQYAGEIQPAAISYVDFPDARASGPHTYSVKVSGTGKINYDGSVSQFSAIVVANNYQMNGIFSYTAVTPPNVDSFFTATFTPTSTTDHVFLFANADMYDLTSEKDGYLQFRRDEVGVGTKATFGNGLGVSTTVGVLDAPQTTSQVVYRLHQGRSTMPTSTHIVSNSGQTKSFFGIVLPEEQAKVTKIAEPLSVVAPASFSGIAQLSVTITTAGEKVLLMFNADLTLVTADPTLVLITILRNYADISGSGKGLMMIKAGDVVNSRRSPMVMWVDSPPAGTHTYMVACMTPTGSVYQFGVDSAQSSIAAVLISDTIRSTAPSIQPSPAPTPPPTYPGTIDCTTSCMMEGDTIVRQNEKPFQILLSTLFTLKFTYGIQNGPQYESDPRFNIIDIRERETGKSLFSYSMTEVLRPQLSYNNTVLAAYGTTISDSSTVITVVVSAHAVSLTTQYEDTTDSATYRISQVAETSGRHYFVYLSNADDPSAGGAVSDITIMGMTDEPTFAPTLAPTRPTATPTEEPSTVPSWVPSIVPSANPSAAPVAHPSAVPSATPVANPSAVPSCVPQASPTADPSVAPVFVPSAVPSTVPSGAHVANPSAVPSAVPLANPSAIPSAVPVANPSAVPSNVPQASPTADPSVKPVSTPSAVPSAAPSTVPVANPSAVPSAVPQTPPSALPSAVPAAAPSPVPSAAPQATPSLVPSTVPSVVPQAAPSLVPSAIPSAVPNSRPSVVPSAVPAASPSAVPSGVPNRPPSMIPSAVPQAVPSYAPSAVPSVVPNSPPSATPSAVPNVPPTAVPSIAPQTLPTASPTVGPTISSIDAPSAAPTDEPTLSQDEPTVEPTTAPNSRPDAGKPTNAPKGTRGPIADQSGEPTLEPSYDPSAEPTEAPVSRPGPAPGPGPGRSNPTVEPSLEPSVLTVAPTVTPSAEPSTAGRPGNPSAAPSATPASVPSAAPSAVPNSVPTAIPSAVPASQPTPTPSTVPHSVPSVVPSAAPSAFPNTQPTATPSKTRTVPEPTAEPTVTPTVIPSAPISTVAPTAPLVSVNTNRKVTVSVALTSRGACTAMWAVDERSLDLSVIALSPLTTPIDATSTRTLSLVLAANSLPPQTVLTFSLTCAQAMASVQVLTNGPPQPGSFTISPSTGVEMMTAFAFTANQWIDKDLPLSYQFGFVSATSGNHLILIPKSVVSHGTSLLAQGLDVEDHKVTLFVTVHDRLEAFSTAYTQAKVLPELSAIELAVQALVNSTGVVSGTKNAISLGSVVLNAVSCAHAPNCTALNRLACRKVAHTCGACADGYVGEVGDVNSRCITIAAANAAALAAVGPTAPDRPTKSGCKSDTDCGEGWEVCYTTTTPLKPFCAVPQKQCPLKCSGHGICVKRNINSGDVEVDCPISRASCVAECQCSSGFGGRGCNTTTAELENRQSLRWKFMEALDFVLHNDDVNIATVSSWSDGLAALTQDPHELSARSAGEVSAFAQGILSVASTVADFSYESAVGVLDSLSAASDSVGGSNSSASGTRTTLAQFTDLVSSQIVSGQDSVEYWYRDFQLASVKRFIPPGDTVLLSLPKSDLQDAQSLESSSVEVTPADTGDEEVTVSLITTPVANYGELGDAFSANPLQLRVHSTTASALMVVTKLVHNAAVAFTSPQEAALMRLRTNCTGSGDRSVREFACPGSNERLVHNCTGHAAGVLTSYCPVLAPSCAVLNTTSSVKGDMSLDTNNTICVVAGYDAYSTTCNCTVMPDPGASTTRRSRRLDDVSDTGVLNVVSASVYATSEFLDTFDSYDEFTSVESLRRVLIVIVMFSTLWAAGILLILTCTGRRKLREPTHKKTLEEIKHKLQSVEKTKTREDVRRYLTNYVVEIFPSVFSNKPIYGRLYGEIKRHHRYLTLFTATEGPSGDKERILTAVDLLSTQTMLMFLLALLYDVQAPTDDGSCVTHLSQDSCLNRRSPFDNSQAYCTWQTPGSDPNDYFCEYQPPRFSLQIVIYISVIVALITAIFQSPLDMCMDLLSAPVADDLKISEEETVINRVGRRLSNAARKVSVVAGNVATATQQKLAATRKPVVGALTRKIPESTEAAHSLASVSMMLIKDSSQQSLKERELHQIRQFHQSGGRHQVYGGARADDSSSDSDSASGSDQEQPEKAERRASRVSKAVSTRTELETTDNVTPARTSIVSSVDATFVRLTEEISCQRRLLVEDDRELFDSQWGLDPTGEFSQGERSRVPFLLPGKPGAQQLIRGELSFVKSETAKKCDKLRVATDQHTGLEILHLFIMDLLGRRTPAARIFETKAMEDFKHTQVVTRTSKLMAVAVLILINAFFVYYAMLTGYRRGLSWQRMYLMACIIQMVVEICLFETMECVWINCAVPILVSAEVRRVGDSILEVVQHMCAENKSVDTSLFLNAPDYLFVSTNVAKKFPSLMESIVVQTYTNHLPGELAKIWQVGSVARINRHQRIRDATVLASVLAGLQLLATAPFLIHRMFVRFSQPFAFSAIVLFWQLIISNVIYLAIALGITAVFFMYCAYMYYLDRFVTKRANSIAPVTAEYVINNHRTRTQTFVGRPTPTVLPLTPKTAKTVKTTFESDKITEFVDLEDEEGVAVPTVCPQDAVEGSAKEKQETLHRTRHECGVPHEQATSNDAADVCAFSDEENDGPLHTPSPRVRGKTVSLESEYSDKSSDDEVAAQRSAGRNPGEPVKTHVVHASAQGSLKFSSVSAQNAKKSPKVLETSSKKDLFTMHLANMSSSDESSNSDSSDSD